MINIGFGSHQRDGRHIVKSLHLLIELDGMDDRIHLIIGFSV